MKNAPLKKNVELMSLLDRERQAWPYDKSLLERLDQRQWFIDSEERVQHVMKDTT